MSHDVLDDLDSHTNSEQGNVALTTIVERDVIKVLEHHLQVDADQFSVTSISFDHISPEALETAEIVLFEIRILETFEDLDRLRGLRAMRPLLPIVAISENNDPGLAMEALRSGATDFVSAEINPHVLAEKLSILKRLSESSRLIEIQNSELVANMQMLRETNAKLRDEMAERIRAEVSKKDAQEQLEQSTKLASLGEMAGGIAHEIRSPLSIITGVTSVLREELENRPEIDDSIKQMVADIEKTADRANDIIRGLKTFSRGAEADPFEKATIKSIVQDTFAFCEEQIRNDGIKLAISEIDPALEINCRPTQISQVLINLLGNARHALEKVKDKWITVDVKDCNDHVRIVVTDSGPGIPKEIQEKIMTAFFTTKPKGVGTGLGLSISKKITKLHGGNLTIDPEFANTRFIATFAKNPPSHEEAMAAA